MRVSDLVAAMEAIAPSRYAEKWDNVGLLVGDPNRVLTRVLLCIDCTAPVFEEAIGRGAEAVLAYHPVIFEGLKRIVAGSLPWRLVHSGMSVISPHTALDVADGGTNDVLADALGMTSRAPLRITVPTEGRGLGRVGSVRPTTRESLLESAQRALGVTHLLVAGPVGGEVHRVAVGAGACGDLLQDVIASGAEFYLTGEMRHHDALKASGLGITVACALHSNSERPTLTRLAERLGPHLPGVVFELSVRDRDPFAVW